MTTTSYPRPGSPESQLIEFHLDLKKYRRDLINTPMSRFDKIMELNKKITDTQAVIDRLEELLMADA